MQNEKENKKSETALREERILNFWEENKTFKKTLEQTEGKKDHRKPRSHFFQYLRC